MSVAEVIDNQSALLESGQVVNFAELSGRSTKEEIIAYGSWLSVHYAVDGHPVSPNTTVLAQARNDNPDFPSADQVQLVMGCAAGLQEALGFVTAKTTRGWTREQYLENGKWLSHSLGTPEIPVKPNRKDLEFAASHNVGAPYEHVMKMFGSMQEYQDALGFVTFATLERWTEQDWLDYGIWLSHALGTPDKPVEPTIRDFGKASKYDIGPATYSIYERYGDLPKYKAALGMRPPRLDYKNWDKATYVQNGKWISHVLGTPEQPRMPTQEDIDELTTLGLMPPKSAIEKKFKRSIRVYQDQLGFVTGATLERWTDDDWIDNGIWLGQILLERGATSAMPTAAQIEEAASHNLIPKRPQIIEKYGSIMEYQKALGFHSELHYKLWSNRDILRHGFEQIQQNNGRLPNAQQYREADGPGKECIRTRFGTVAKFHERLGFTDYGHLSRDDLVSFGVRWAHENGGRILKGSDITRLSEAQRGPSRSYIYSNFDTLTNYQDEVKEAYAAFVDFRGEHLQARTSSGPTLDFLARDFKNNSEWKAEFEDRLRVVAELRRGFGVKVLKLCEVFNKSRRTIMWDKDDFIYFRSLVDSKAEGDHGRTIQALHLLDSLGLCPYLDEIEEVFGSLENFVEYE